MRTKIFTIMFTEVVDETKDQKNLTVFLSIQKKIINEVIEENQGTIVKKIGNGYMIVFKTPTIALISAREIQSKIKEIKKNSFSIKIGINTGEVNVEEELDYETMQTSIDVFGNPVNIAARVKSISKAGEIYTTDSTIFCIDHSNFKFKKVGKKNLKGVKGKTQIHLLDTSKNNFISKENYFKGSTVAIMNTDIAGYTNKVSNQSRKELNDFIQNQKDIMEPIIKHFKGKVIKTIGDAYVVMFESPTIALYCAKKIQNEIIVYNNKIKKKKKQFKIRIGINTGEIQIKYGEIFGKTLEIAEKVESSTIPGSTFFTKATYLNINTNEIAMYDVGKKSLKGIDHKVRLYQVDNGEMTIYRYTINTLILLRKKIKTLLINLFVTSIVIFTLLFVSYIYLKGNTNIPIGLQEQIKTIDKEVKIIKFKYKLFVKKISS